MMQIYFLSRLQISIRFILFFYKSVDLSAHVLIKIEFFFLIVFTAFLSMVKNLYNKKNAETFIQLYVDL